MKHRIFFAIALLASSTAFASSGQYICKIADAVDQHGFFSANAVQQALNSMGCDTTKPVSTTSDAGSGGVTSSILVCCVQK